MTARRWWLLLTAIATVEVGCLYGTWLLTRIDVP